jgi:hypothetical protein
MLAAEERSRHFYIVGKTGTDKRRLLFNLIEQDLGGRRLTGFRFIWASRPERTARRQLSEIK